MTIDKHVSIICGHYGSGKSTFAINYAISRQSVGEKVYLADLDVVNPYFRSREQKDMLLSKNIKVIGSNIEESGSDLPAVSGELFGVLAQRDSIAIIDLGGDVSGTHAFANFRESIKENDTDVFFVFNANRAETQTACDARKYLTTIEYSLKLKVSAIINNTHLMDFTTVKDIMQGEDIANELSIKTNIPVKYTCITEAFNKNNENLRSKFSKFILGFKFKCV